MQKKKEFSNPPQPKISLLVTCILHGFFVAAILCLQLTSTLQDPHLSSLPLTSNQTSTGNKCNGLSMHTFSLSLKSECT